jgi:hypothetical protein
MIKRNKGGIVLLNLGQNTEIEKLSYAGVVNAINNGGRPLLKPKK